MVRVFTKNRTFRLEAPNDPKDFIILKPYGFADVPEKYTADITFKMGVKGGDIEVFTDKKQGEAIEAKAYTEPAKTEPEAKPAAPKKKASAK